MPHESQLVLPIVPAFFPIGHSSQVDLPVSGWYSPTGHDLHAMLPGSSLYNPAAQSAQLDAPVEFRAFPGTHLVQLDAPVAELKVPCEQSRHVEIPGAGAYLPFGQSEQVDWPEEDVIFPRAHGSHAPVTVVFCPGAQIAGQLMNPEFAPLVRTYAIFPHFPAVVTPQLAFVVHEVPRAIPSLTETQIPSKAFNPSTMSSASG